jgi:hypothetical protein
VNERLGSLAHELRNLLTSATLAYAAIKGGQLWSEWALVSVRRFVRTKAASDSG